MQMRLGCWATWLTVLSVSPSLDFIGIGDTDVDAGVDVGAEATWTEPKISCLHASPLIDGDDV